MYNRLLESLINCYDCGYPPSTIFTRIQIEELSKNRSVEIRAWIAAALIHEPFSDLTVDILSRLSIDKDELVRTEAIDSLCVFPCRKSFSALKCALNDNCILPRSYAALGIAMVGKIIAKHEAESLLSDMENDETNSFVLSSIYEGMYLLGNTKYLNKIFSLFPNEDYHTKCAVIRSLDNVLNPANQSDIARFLHSIDKTDLPIAIRNAIQPLNDRLASLNENHP